jgi:tetratricopeptide (TPR) repeat protein/tRNA A-37 threonylcarbamoyl transferase component Bud32
MPELIGQTLGGYRILEQIGRGGMATVYKAFQPSLDRNVAIKILPAYYAEQDETFIKRFRLEARAVARLRHPNILIVHDYGEQDGTTFIAMEYVEAGTLTERLGQPMPLPEIEVILRQVAAALGYAHEQGVIHRDVKPSNILLPKPDWPLLTDFGLAKIVGGAHLTQTGTIAGTPAYMSPEQGRGEKLDHRTDLYSLGIVLYEMATGVVPFTAETPMAVIVKHIIEPLPLPRAINPELPEAVERVILKALAKDPSDRFAQAGEMAQAFSATLSRPSPPAPSGHLHPLAPPAGAVQLSTLPFQGAQHSEARGARAEGERPPSRRRLVWAVVALIAVLVIGALALGSRIAAPTELFASDAGKAAASASLQESTRTIDQLLADAQARLAGGEIDAALADFQEAASADPSNTDLLWNIASTLKDSGYPEWAKAFADQAVADGPDDEDHHDRAGWFYYELGYYPEAVARFGRILELNPEALWAYIGIADASLDMGDVGQARLALDSVTARPVVEDSDLYESVGWGYSQLEAWPEAQAAFRQALNMDPGSIEAWDGLTDATYNGDGPDAAWLVAQEALAANPGGAALHENAAELAWERGDLAAAEDEYQQAIAVDPSYVSAYIGLADLYNESGRLTESLVTLESGIAANPKDSWLQQTLGQTLLDQGDAEGAYAHFSEALALDPSSGWIALETASAYYQYSADVNGTSELLERAGTLEADDPYLLDSIGQVYENMGNCPLAADYYRRTLELDPSIENSQAGLTRCQG